MGSSTARKVSVTALSLILTPLAGWPAGPTTPVTGKTLQPT